MQAVMKFAMTHLVSLLCGVAALAFIVIGVIGMSSRSVVQEMNRRIQSTGAADIQRLRSSAKNQAMIEAEEERGRRFDAEFEETKAILERINKREPIMEGVFPPPTVMTPEAQIMPFRFRERYNEAIGKLPAPLVGGTLPDQADIQEEIENVRDLRQQEEEAQLAQAGAGQPAQPPPGPGSSRLQATPPTRGGLPLIRGGEPAARGTEPKYDPIIRANVAKAKSIRCYYDPTTFHRSPIALEGASAPTADEMWKAQVSLWIQQDIVSAIDKLNSAAAEQVQEGDACVEHVPVKHLMAIRVEGYVTSVGLLPFDSLTSARPAQQVEPTFTGRVSDDQFDVLRVEVQAVVDQRELLRVVDAISKENFYTCVKLGSAAPPPDLAARGYLYGATPVVIATMTFEAYMARSIYDPIMPPTMRQQITGGQP
jgi:hypothetical protein